MRPRHEPDNEFVERLEWQIGREIQRRNRFAQAPRRWASWPRMRNVFAAMGLVIISMGVGAISTAVGYQLKGQVDRNVLLTGFERRADLARQRLALLEGGVSAAERMVALGTASHEKILEARAKLAEAAAQVKSIELQIEEVRITGREPVNEISSPVVSKRDFVSDRLRAGMAAREAALELERFRLQDTEKSVSLGAVDSFDIEIARVRVAEAEAAIESLKTKVEIRQQYLNRKMDAGEAELRVLQSEAEQRRKTLAAKNELARKEVQRVARNVALGTSQSVEQAEAALRVQELETEMAKADLDLAVIRRNLQRHRGGR